MMKPEKVVLICVPLNILGGNFVHIGEMSKNLAMRGFKLEFIIDAQEGKEKIISIFQSYGTVHDIGSRNVVDRIFRSGRAVRGCCSGDKNVVVHSFSMQSQVASWFAGRKRLNVYSLEGDIVEKESSRIKKRIYLMLLRLSVFFVKKYVAIGEFTKKQYCVYNPKIKDKITVIHSGMASTLIENLSGIEREFGDRIRLGFVGGLSKAKGLIEAVETYKALKKSGRNATLSIFGKGDLEDYARLQARQDEDINYFGFCPDKKFIYSAFDVLLFPSIAEGLPWGVLEAMASGVLVISNRVGAVDEVIEDGENGYIVNETEDFLHKAQGILCDMDKKTFMRISSRAKAAIVTGFDSEGEIKKIIAVYKECVNELAR